MKRLFCWSGGGLPGLDIHCGIWRALSDACIVADQVHGTSAGAIIAALYASGWSQPEAEQMLRDLTDDDVREPRLAWKLRLNSAPTMMKRNKIDALLKILIPETLLTGPGCGIHMTRNIDGAEVCEHENLRDAVRASMSISGVWESVRLISMGPDGFHGRYAYSDGGTTANLPLPTNVLANFDEVWLLIAKRPLGDYRKLGSAMSRLVWNADVLAEDQVNRTIDLARSLHPRVRVIRPYAQAPRGSLHFDHKLIDDAAAQAAVIIRHQVER